MDTPNTEQVNTIVRGCKRMILESVEEDEPALTSGEETSPRPTFEGQLTTDSIDEKAKTSETSAKVYRRLLAATAIKRLRLTAEEEDN